MNTKYNCILENHKDYYIDNLMNIITENTKFTLRDYTLRDSLKSHSDYPCNTNCKIYIMDRYQKNKLYLL